MNNQTNLNDYIDQYFKDEDEKKLIKSLLDIINDQPPEISHPDNTGVENFVNLLKENFETNNSSKPSDIDINYAEQEEFNSKIDELNTLINDNTEYKEDQL
tara:strand:+ start:211 stop:513 length:303 start_codon:yes stop_codon:yes gene_type:complete